MLQAHWQHLICRPLVPVIPSTRTYSQIKYANPGKSNTSYFRGKSNSTLTLVSSGKSVQSPKINTPVEKKGGTRRQKSWGFLPMDGHFQHALIEVKIVVKKMM